MPIHSPTAPFPTFCFTAVHLEVCRNNGSFFQGVGTILEATAGVCQRAVDLNMEAEDASVAWESEHRMVFYFGLRPHSISAWAYYGDHHDSTAEFSFQTTTVVAVQWQIVPVLVDNGNVWIDSFHERCLELLTSLFPLVTSFRCGSAQRTEFGDVTMSCRRQCAFDKYELKQMPLVDKRHTGMPLLLLLQRVCMQFMYRENVWKLATDAVESMHASTAFNVVSRNTRYLDIRISDNQTEDSMPLVLPGQLAELLLAPFRQWRTLVFRIAETQAYAFDNEFHTTGIELRTVTTLMVGAYCDFMLPLCPNVEHMPTYGWVWLHSNRARLPESIHSPLLVQQEGRNFEMNEWWLVDLLNGSYSYSEPVQGTRTGGCVLPGCRFYSSKMRTWGRSYQKGARANGAHPVEARNITRLNGFFHTSATTMTRPAQPDENWRPSPS
ncbi:hypothetical protein ARMSODRAFT_980425 [Armillaria solidipes]|uniref:Uncharacterized protein n=1 Tax=Armillaria solidipes TaxID=1076256 RepID=A0A2H3BG22_9AGAR|nr:hypothetical protein ARMSODRAFT_980425 [Armillaria solidipes]